MSHDFIRHMLRGVALSSGRNIKWQESPNANRAYAYAYVNDMDAMRTLLTELMMFDPRSAAPVKN